MRHFALLLCLMALPVSAQPTKKYILCLGDSITGGTFGDVRSVCRRICETLGAGYGCFNGGISGDKVGEATTRWNSYYQPDVSGSPTVEDTWRRWSAVVLAIGVNDIYTDSAGTTSSTTIYTAWASLADDIRGSGGRLVVSRILPVKSFASWIANDQTQANSLWVSQQSYCTTNSTSTSCVNTSSLGSSGDNEILDAAYDSGDGIHLNQAGIDAWAALLVPYVR